MSLFSSFWLYRLGGCTTISGGNGSEDKKENNGQQADFLREGAAGGMHWKEFVVLLLVIRFWTPVIFKQQTAHKAKSFELRTLNLPVRSSEVYLLHRRCISSLLKRADSCPQCHAPILRENITPDPLIVVSLGSDVMYRAVWLPSWKKSKSRTQKMNWLLLIQWMLLVVVLYMISNKS